MFENFDFTCLNQLMKNSGSTENKFTSRYLLRDERLIHNKTSDINVLLNRVKSDKKKESRNKIYFSAITSLGVLLFCASIF